MPKKEIFFETVHSRTTLLFSQSPSWNTYLECQKLLLDHIYIQQGPTNGHKGHKAHLRAQGLGSAVPARLGLKALALAWPEGALAFQNPRPSHGSWLRLGHGLAWPRPGLLQQVPYLVFAHYCYLARAAHTSIDVGVRAREVLRRGVILFRLCLWASAKG
jgi:hypothetical protein